MRQKYFNLLLFFGLKFLLIIAMRQFIKRHYIVDRIPN
jgi:hypothetical protein